MANTEYQVMNDFTKEFVELQIKYHGKIRLDESVAIMTNYLIFLHQGYENRAKELGEIINEAVQEAVTNYGKDEGDVEVYEEQENK